jgi:hypothetical protein
MEEKRSPDYAWWVDYKGVWDLRQAANLYLGFEPDTGGTFYEFSDLLEKYDRGLILTDSNTLWSVNMLISPEQHSDQVFDKDGNSKISLENFVKDKVRLGVIHPVVGNDGLSSGLHFKPEKIILFFKENFLNQPPQELLDILELNKQESDRSENSSQNNQFYEDEFENIPYTPAYLEFMLHAAKELNLSPDKRATMSHITKWLNDNWPPNLPGKSENLIGSMATLLRRPKDKLGGNTKWKKG